MQDYRDTIPEVAAAREAAKDITPSIRLRLYNRLKSAGLSKRTANVLAADLSDAWFRQIYGPQDIDEQVAFIAGSSDSELLRTPGLGRKALAEIRAAL